MKKTKNLVFHILKLIFRIQPSYLPLLVLSSLFRASLPFLNVIIPKFIIDELTGGKRIEVLVLLVLLTILGNFILGIINRSFDKIFAVKSEKLNFEFDSYLNHKMMTMRFEYTEDPCVLDLKEQAFFPIKNLGTIRQLVDSLAGIFSQVLMLIGFVSIIATLDAVLIIAILLIVLLNSVILKKSQDIELNINQEMMPVNRKFSVFFPLAFNFSAAKDIRLYNMKDFILNKQKGYVKETVDLFRKLFETLGKYNGLTSVNSQVQMVFIYIYITFWAFIGRIGIGDFTMYTSAAYEFSQTLSQVISSVLSIRQCCAYLKPFGDLEEVMDKQPTGGTRHINGFESVEFRDVSFHYPSTDVYALKSISITIRQGEKLSIIGMNGAGKSTFIKLLVRLYEPTSGEILLNGFPIDEYDYHEYINLFSTVFQDFSLFAFSLEENIIMSDESANCVKLSNALHNAGLEKKIALLPCGIHTEVYKIFSKDGIEPSGGEGQKIAIARAIYKDTPIVVLDEPASALDPISEYNLYRNFDNMIHQSNGTVKTAIYISHRMSSCRFCDKIAVFHEGSLIQYGAHDTLLKESGSKYEELWHAQAQYYS